MHGSPPWSVTTPLPLHLPTPLTHSGELREDEHLKKCLVVPLAIRCDDHESEQQVFCLHRSSAVTFLSLCLLFDLPADVSITGAFGFAGVEKAEDVVEVPPPPHPLISQHPSGLKSVQAVRGTEGVEQGRVGWGWRGGGM